MKDKTPSKCVCTQLSTEAGGVAARRRCGPILPGEASAADARESIQCGRTPAAVIGRRQGQLCRCFRQVLESECRGLRPYGVYMRPQPQKVLRTPNGRR
jgi:hypothetical protein